MQTFLQQVALGVSDGVIYASMALALVLIYKGTQVLNAGQGEMALFCAYVAATLYTAGLPLPLVFAGAMGLGFLMGVGLRVLVAPIQRSQAGLLGVLIVTLAVFLGLNSLAGMIWGHQPKAFPSPFPSGRLPVGGGVSLSYHEVGMIAVIMAVLLLLTFLFMRTRFGLYVRSAAENAHSARLSGVPVGRMLAIAWGLASAVGALGGLLIVHTTYITLPVMFPVLIWGLASAIVGGMDSPVGAVAGGLILGVVASLASFYIDFIGGDFKIVTSVALIIVFVLVRPQGLFGSAQVQRV